MKQFLFMIALLCSLSSVGQEGFSFGFGGVTSYLQFQAFEDYALSYNTQFSGSPTFVKELNYNPFGTGYEGNFQYRIGKLYTALKVGKTSSLASKASFTSGDRIFKFKNYAFDVAVGFTIGQIISPYVTLTINSMNIDTYYKYTNGFESYGSARPLSGIYTSSKLYSVVGLRIEKALGRFGFYLDASYPLIAKTYLGGSFDKDAIQTDSPYFPKDNTTYGDLVVENAMPETYRNIRFGLGIQFYLTKQE